jgi:adenosylhomocysteine nucleosidase
MTSTSSSHCSSVLAITAAMPEELDACLQAMPGKSPVHLGGRTFWCGHWHGHEVVAALSGIGKVAASLTTTLLCSHFGASRLIFTGVAGGLNSSTAGPVCVGDVVVASELLQHDLDASPLFPRHEVPGLNITRFSSCPTISAALMTAAHQTLSFSQGQRVHHGLIVSGDRFVSTQSEARALQAELPDALGVEMEGAAVAQVCHDFAVPFGVVRSISDRADDDAHTDFVRFVKDIASPHALAIIRAALQQLNTQTR